MIRIAAFFFAFHGVTANANVLGLFPAGAGCKSAAMETAIDCSEAQTLLYNPAVMNAAPKGFAGEVGLARVQYSYEHPSFDPVFVNLYTPMFSEGWKGTFADEKASWGFAVMPSSMATLDINGIPRRVNGNPESLNIKASKRQFHLPLGGSYRFDDLGLSAGLSVIYTYDERSLKGSTVTNPNSRLVNLKGSGHFFRPLLGLSWHQDVLSSGVSYMFPLTKKFKGKTQLADEPDFNTEQVDYDPGVLMTAIRGTVAGFDLSINLNHVFGTRGASIQRDGLNRKTERADFKDAKHLGARLAYQSADYGDISLGLAYLESYWGAGYYYKDEEGFAHHEIGHVFGQFNAIPVHNQSVTWRKSFDDWQTHAAIFRSAGSTTVGNGADNPGYYQIEFVSLTCGVRRTL